MDGGGEGRGERSSQKRKPVRISQVSVLSSGVGWWGRGEQEFSSETETSEDKSGQCAKQWGGVVGEGETGVSSETETSEDKSGHCAEPWGEGE